MPGGTRPSPSIDLRMKSRASSAQHPYRPERQALRGQICTESESEPIFHADSQTTMRSAPNRRWSLNVLSDAFACRRRLRMPSEVDDLKRKCLALVADMSLSGVRVVRKLDGLLAADGRKR